MPLPPAPPAQSRPPSLLGAVLDTRFQTLATPIVITWIYRGCLLVISVVTVGCFLLALAVASLRNGWFWGILGMIAAPLIGAVWVLIVRVTCEFTLIRFRASMGPPRLAPTAVDADSSFGYRPGSRR